MSIDGIGKPNGLTGITPAQSGIVAPSSSSAGEAFKIHQSTPPQATTALERLRAGELTVSQYLDQKVEAATQHLAGRVSAEQLAFIHENLRAQLASDPVLLELVQAASGSMPPTHHE